GGVEVDAGGADVGEVGIGDGIVVYLDRVRRDVTGHPDTGVGVGDRVAGDAAATVRPIGIEHEDADHFGVRRLVVGADDGVVGDVEVGVVEQQQAARIDVLRTREADGGDGVVVDATRRPGGLDAILGVDGLGTAARDCH